MRRVVVEALRLQARVMLAVACVVAGCLALSGPAWANAPWWHGTTSVSPTHLPPGGEGTIYAQAVNVGDAKTSGPITLSYTLPQGVSVAEEEAEPGVFRPEISFYAFTLTTNFDLGPAGFIESLFHYGLCSVSGQTVSCSDSEALMEGPLGAAFPNLAHMAPFENLEMRVRVKAAVGAEAGSSKLEVVGGGAPRLVTRRPFIVSASAPVFGVQDLAMTPEEEGGRVDAQAGSHPFQLTTTFSLNQSADPVRPPALPRNLQFRLPPGLIGNPTIIPQCSEHDFKEIFGGGNENRCPQDTVVGVASITFDEPVTLGIQTKPVPLFNLTPGLGEPARFGFEFANAPVTLDTAVRTGSDYGVTVSVNNITELANLLSSSVTFWGAPGDQRHDSARGWGCLVEGALAPGLPCLPTAETEPPPFLTMPTACSLPFVTSVEGVSWPTRAHPAGVLLAGADYSLQDELEHPLGITGCNRLPFNPSIEVQPDVQSASTPTGLAVHVRVPQEVNRNAVGLASASVKDTTVALPEGMGLNPAGANGLEACSESEIGFEKVDPDGTDRFSPSLPAPFCPAASKIGSAKFKIPVIAHPLEGAVYLASQNANPFGSLVALYIVAEDPVSGTLVKLAGEVHLTETGQVITSLRNSPQAPLEEAEFHFFGGERAPLATPASCGSYETQASFAPWSGNPPVPASSTFRVTSGPNGAPCQDPAPFAPTLAGGSTNVQAAAFSPLTTTISRPDGDQDIQGVQITLPPGLSGMIAGVTPCGEAQADAGVCGQASLVGHTIVSVGLGGDPYSVKGGEVFLTGPYRGAPFGLSIVEPAKAGPFDLGKVIVRARLDIDPLTAQATVTTDPTGPYAIPHVLDGIPLQIKHVNVLIDRSQFAFNPTNCDPLRLTASIQSTQGITSQASVPFQVTNCAALKFAPKFTVSTNGRTSKANGASLRVKLVYPNAPQGTQTNIAKVKVALPRQLPSRLTTLQKACLVDAFEANPANCPPQSIIGHATVHTPLLPVPLTGPAYFVSHGGEAFPTLTIVLQGDNVTVRLIGNTLIRKGITTTTFKATPDIPFSTFELTLPQGRYSALTANGNLCKADLMMPTQFTAQNGVKRNQRTHITVTGCHRKHRAKRKHRKKHS
jgi:hypothetical protein